jgi:N-acyl homoserine lactone hydrolase
MKARFHDAIPNYDVELPDPVRDPLVAAFDLVGLDPSIVSAVGVSHFHLDHSGGVRWFAGHVPVHAQRAELDFALSAAHPEPERAAIYRVDIDDPAIDWKVASGDTEIAPGVTAVLTAGHTPGHQSFMVELDDSVGGGGYVFAFDAADLQENIDDELAVGETIGVPNEASIEPIRRMKAIAAERGLRLLPGHDPVVWPAFTKELGYPTWE